jgi:hypothetical protein
MKKVTDIHRHMPKPKPPTVKPPQQPAIEMHTKGIFGRKIKKIPYLLSFGERISIRRRK